MFFLKSQGEAGKKQFPFGEFSLLLWIFSLEGILNFSLLYFLLRFSFSCRTLI